MVILHRGIWQVGIGWKLDVGQELFLQAWRD
jgi:hypothetical protein